MKELIKELREWKEKTLNNKSVAWYAAMEKFDKILSRHSAEVEPLAVLADRKGYWIDTNQHRLNTFRINLFRYQQSVGLHDCQMHEPKEIKAPTYAECEAKARAYLERLDDAREAK